MLIRFSNIKRVYLRISKYLAQFFLLIPYSNIKKEYLQILKNLAQFFSHLFFQILKKHTYKSQNTPFHNNKYFKGNNLDKNHYTNKFHKNHYTNG